MMSHLLQHTQNLIQVTDWKTPFTDAFAQFSLGFSDQHMGPNFVHPKSAMATYELCSPLLQLWSRDEDRVSVVHRQQIVSTPWLVTEQTQWDCRGHTVDIHSETLFLDSRKAQIRIQLRTTSEESLEPDPFWAGCVRDDTENRHAMTVYQSANTGKRNVLCIPCPQGLEIGYDPGDGLSDLPHLRFRLLSEDLNVLLVDGPPWGGTGPTSGPQYYQFVPDTPLRLTADSPLDFRIEVQFRGANAGEPLDPWTTFEPADWAGLSQQAEDRFRQNSQADGLEPADRHALRARTGLLCDGVRGHNGEFGSWIASLCSFGTQDFSCSFFWDSLFSATALSRFHPEAARGAIATVFTRQNPFDGASPERKWNYSCPQHSLISCPQSPIAAWALNHYLDRNTGEHDLAFARGILPSILANHHFWKEHSDADGDGLSEYNWSGQIGDNSQMWDPVAVSGPDQHSGCFWLPPVASVTCNSFLYRDAHEIARLLERLGHTEEVPAWQSRADEIAEHMQAILWVEKSQAYQDFNHRSREHHAVNTFFQFLPLWAGVPMPEESRRKLIEDRLLDPDQYFGAVPFPSAPYNSPDYEAGGYWRGRAWSHVSCWILEGLWKAGYQAEADEAANRILAWQENWNFRENMHSDPSEFSPEGFVYYNWGCAAYLFLHHRMYRVDS